MEPRERPILFSAPMVRAILDGRKTQTRRVLSHQPLDVLPMNGNPGQWVALMTRDPNTGQVFRCRYGQPGDRLWVRETFGVWVSNWTDYGWETEGLTYDGSLKVRPENTHWVKHSVEYRATSGYELCNGERWRPSIHMPRWASRLTLAITNVRAQRLHDITDADAQAEGVTLPRREAMFYDGKWVAAFAKLWDSINGARPGCAWADNPWTWVIEFERLNS